ncbi:MAG TPA: DUF3617 domain-containing protein [Pseudomonadales bacterium]|nr:DUF3617 domain-containing protein [Pseudomonadales bacterium]
MPNRFTLLAITIGTTLCLPAFAIPDNTTGNNVLLKPGLWKIQGSSALYGHTIPDIPALIGIGPEALQNQVTDMMHKNRVRVRDDGTVTICFTPKQIARNVFVNDEGSGCTVSKGLRRGNIIHFDIVCQAPKGDGGSDVILHSPTHWTAATSVNVSIRGMNQAITNTASGTWLGSTCPLGQ